MRLPVTATKAHKGKSLELDREHETIRLLGAKGEQLGTASWESVIDLIQALRAQTRPENHETSSLVVNVRYGTADGQWVTSRASGVGDEGLFIECNDPLPVGTKLMMEVALPDCPSEWLGAKGTVAWVCPKADHYTFSSGMGVRFTRFRLLHASGCRRCVAVEGPCLREAQELGSEFGGMLVWAPLR